MSFTGLSGPMFEPSETMFWQASDCMRCRHRKEGAHYNIFNVRGVNGMAALREMFPNGDANELNFVLFSTSGVHGTYGTIEDAEAIVARGFKDEDGDESHPSVTFLLVHPRIVCLRYGNCEPTTADDFAFLKRLRSTSWAAVLTIGAKE